MLICFEGIDGAGKKTQSDMLIAELQKKGRQTIKYSYPDYDSRYGKMIKEYLEKKIDLNVMEQFLVYALDFVKDNENIRKGLKEGKAVIMDRFFFSTVAYQCANGFDYNLAKKFIELLDLPKPDMLIYLDINGSISLDRKIKEKGSVDRHEERKSFQDRVNEMYKREMREGFGAKRWEVVDGTQAKEKVHEDVMKKLDGLLIK